MRYANNKPTSLSMKTYLTGDLVKVRGDLARLFEGLDGRLNDGFWFSLLSLHFLTEKSELDKRNLRK